MTELYAREIVGTVLNPVTFSHLQRPRWKYIQSAETHNVFETGTVVRRDHLDIELPSGSYCQRGNNRAIQQRIFLSRGNCRGLTCSGLSSLGN